MLAAILFDLDGTLVNSDPVHFLVWQDCLAEFGIEIDHAYYRQHISGRVNADIVRDILPQLSVAAGEQFVIEKEAQFRQRGDSLERMPGLTEFLVWVDTQDLKQAVVTNAPQENARFMLAALGLQARFPVTILAEDAPPGKPDPAPYLLALERLNVKADQAIAFEDSPSGIRAAVAAGIYTVGVASSHPADKLLGYGARRVIQDFTHMTWLTAQPEFLETVC